LSIVDCRLSIVDCRLSIVDCRLSIVDCRLSIWLDALDLNKFQKFLGYFHVRDFLSFQIFPVTGWAFKMGGCAFGPLPALPFLHAPHAAPRVARQQRRTRSADRLGAKTHMPC
jgi:hypothetical protein